MPKYNADGLFEPIEITLGGKEYVIEEIGQEVFDQVQAIAKDEEISGSVAVYTQLGLLLGEKVEVLNKIDVRRAGATLKYLVDLITKQLGGETGNA